MLAKRRPAGIVRVRPLESKSWPGVAVTPSTVTATSVALATGAASVSCTATERARSLVTNRRGDRGGHRAGAGDRDGVARLGRVAGPIGHLAAHAGGADRQEGAGRAGVHVGVGAEPSTSSIAAMPGSSGVVPPSGAVRVTVAGTVSRGATLSTIVTWNVFHGLVAGGVRGDAGDGRRADLEAAAGGRVAGGADEAAALVLAALPESHVATSRERGREGEVAGHDEVGRRHVGRIRLDVLRPQLAEVGAALRPPLVRDGLAVAGDRRIAIHLGGRDGARAVAQPQEALAALGHEVGRRRGERDARRIRGDDGRIGAGRV